MRKLFSWLGVAGLAAGLLLIAANVIMHFMGVSASYNIGDPSKFEFRLISFWHIGLALACIGLLLGLVSRRL
jgi:hypothetical protein